MFAPRDSLEPVLVCMSKPGIGLLYRGESGVFAVGVNLQIRYRSNASKI